MNSYHTPARVYAKGIGNAVADRTINRKITRYLDEIEEVTLTLKRRDDVSLDSEVEAYCRSNGLIYHDYTVNTGNSSEVNITIYVIGKKDTETWEDVAWRVAKGNSMLNPDDQDEEFDKMHHHLRQASILMSGRHLQHGDESQSTRPMEVFTNCSTSALSFLTFYLLLNGSGVGRAYDDAMMKVDYRNLPIVVPVISSQHADAMSGEIVALDLVNAEHLYQGCTIHMYKVPDSREGWAKAVEKLEVMAFSSKYKEDVLFLDFSDVRPRGAPIRGMQERPASGPAPLMSAIARIARLRDTNMEPWRQTMYADHYLAECVLVGGARRAARMSTKTWRDKNVLDFIEVKRGGYLWSSNNSVTVDKEFWELNKLDSAPEGREELWEHAKKVLDRIAYASYHDGTGEPGLINQDKLTQNDEGLSNYSDGKFAESERYKLEPESLQLTKSLAKVVSESALKMITNPCVTKDTWIHTSTGAQQVKDLLDSPYMASVNGKNYPATAFWKTGDKDVFTVKTDRGYEIEATDNHKLLIETPNKAQEWVEVKDLQHGDKLVLNINNPRLEEETGPRFDIGWLVGEVLGDGGYNPSKYAGYARFWGTDRVEMAKRAQNIAKKLPFSGIRRVPLSDLRKENEANKAYTVQTRAIDELLEDLLEPSTKNILPELEKQDMEFCRGFVRGFFDADGSVQGNLTKGVSIRLGQSNLPNLKAVQRILLRLGIVSTLYENRKDAGTSLLPDGKGGSKEYNTKAQHELIVSKSSFVRFGEIIGFSEPAKAARLKEINSSRKRAPYKDSFTTKVTDIVYKGVEEVYDCTVERVHRFDANGIIAHNCGEISLIMLGGYCVIADVVPYHAGNDLMSDTAWDNETEDAFRVATRALIRTNLMDCLYKPEVDRTNRIGVGFTGLHEYAWLRFGYGFRDLIDEEKSKDFWLTMARFKKAVKDEAKTYSAKLGVTTPHTDTTVKPAGTTSKLFGLTEGAHLPSMREYLRWVQFRSDDPLIDEYRTKGYPVRELKIYEGTTIVGFPTQPEVCSLGMGDKLVTAAEATPEEQYEYLRLLEKYWISGIENNKSETGNQVSYTLKYDPKVVDYQTFLKTLTDGQAKIRCCSVMPQADTTAYEYQPEEPVTKRQYEMICEALTDSNIQEDIDRQHVDCGGGACPIDFNK